MPKAERPIQTIDEFMRRPKRRKGCGITAFAIVAPCAIGLCSLWIVSAVLQMVFPEKRAQKKSSLMTQKAWESKPAISVDTLIGFDKAKEVLSDSLNAMNDEDKAGMERALRYVLLAYAQKTAKGSDYLRINDELRALHIDTERQVWDWAAVAVANTFTEQGFSEIVPTAADSKKGAKSLTYDGMKEGILGYKKLRENGLQNRGN